MTSVEMVKALCKERKISLHKLEMDLGFANGYVGQLRRGMFPADRLARIAEYLGVSADYLLGAETEKAPTQEGERESGDPVFTYAMSGEVDKLTPERKEMLRGMAQYLIDQQAKEEQEKGRK